MISSGIYGYPKDEALEVARSAIEDFLRHHDVEVYKRANMDRKPFSKIRTGKVRCDRGVFHCEWEVRHF